MAKFYGIQIGLLLALINADGNWLYCICLLPIYLGDITDGLLAEPSSIFFEISLLCLPGAVNINQGDLSKLVVGRTASGSIISQQKIFGKWMYGDR